MNDTEKLVHLMKQVVFPAFPGGGYDVKVGHQLPEHGFYAIATHLVENGVTLPVRCKGCRYYHRMEDGYYDCIHEYGLDYPDANDFCCRSEKDR